MQKRQGNRFATQREKMRYDPLVRHRRSVRIRGYDYAQAGYYFITICTHARECLFGEISEGRMCLNALGQIVQAEWLRTPVLRPRVILDEYIFMPNHVHGIIVLSDEVGHADTDKTSSARQLECFGRPRSDSVPTIVRLFKSATTKRLNERRGTAAGAVWQRNYYEHIIRDAESLNRIRQYILENPLHWAEDSENPAAQPPRPGARS